LLLPVLEASGLRVVASRAGMYLWVEMPEELVPVLLERGVVVSPGRFFGPSGAGYVRFALVPTEEECRRAAAILEEVLAPARR
jgi:aspartate/methionine/tyrosine aminotransferase